MSQDEPKPITEDLAESVWFSLGMSGRSRAANHWTLVLANAEGRDLTGPARSYLESDPAH